MKYKNFLKIMLICLITSANVFPLYKRYKPNLQDMSPLFRSCFYSELKIKKTNKMKQNRDRRRQNPNPLPVNQIKQINEEMRIYGKIHSNNIPVSLGNNSKPEASKEDTFIRCLVRNENYDSCFKFIKEHSSKLNIDKNFLPRLLFDAFYYDDGGLFCDSIRRYELYAKRGNRTLFFQKTVGLFLKDFFDLDYQHPKTGATILMLESFLGCEKMVQLLVKMGADASKAYASKKDNNGLSALDYALIGHKYYYHCSQQKYAKAVIQKEEIDWIINNTVVRQKSYNIIKDLLLSHNYAHKETLSKEDHKRALKSIIVNDINGYFDNYLKHLQLLLVVV